MYKLNVSKITLIKEFYSEGDSVLIAGSTADSVEVFFSVELSVTLEVVEVLTLDGFGSPTNETFSFRTSEFLLNT